MKNPFCKNCETFEVDENGAGFCPLLGQPRDGDEHPANKDGVKCWTKRTRVKLSGAELSLIYSANGKKGGRPRTYPNGRGPTKQVCMREMDHAVLFAYAQASGTSMAEVIHNTCKVIVSTHPELRPESWKD